ncbi:MAG: M23 family metallopeptidase [Bacteroidetes bacterium]|nr:M23 family metallopeptidase [Bacteroidota bacterium]MCL1968224.1 M23 family metallopeptidase [Bacteroidota bacterium]
MKKIFLAFVFLAGINCIFAQKEKNIVDLLIECYENYYELNKKTVSHTTLICPPEPENFYNFFKTTFIDFRSLREGENVKTFSFNDSLCSPLQRNLELTSKYGMRNGRKHFGVDFRVAVGDPVCSIFCGKVRVAKWDKTYGYVIVVRHYNMSETVYAHLEKILVAADQEVKAGQIIGLGGNTGISSGPHLHFELRYKGFPIDPMVNNKFLTKLPVY